MSGEKKLILVAEDDDSVRAMLQRALSTFYRVETASDGLAALRRLAEAPQPDLLICDIMMPGADGLTVARHAKANPASKQLPIIFLTARTTPSDVIQGIQAGARLYITKPFKLDDLLQKVRKVVGA
jgi:CheY-like chemotaxis protein